MPVQFAVLGPTVLPSGASTWNPADKSVNLSLDATNLIVTMNSNSVDSAIRSTGHIGTRKVYWECKITTLINGFTQFFGFGQASTSLNQNLGFDAGLSFGWRGQDGAVVVASTINATLPTYALNDVVRFAVDGANGLMWGSVNNGTWTGNGAGDPATGTNPLNLISIGMTAGDWYAMSSNGNLSQNSVEVGNFGQSYAFSPPSGYVSL